MSSHPPAPGAGRWSLSGFWRSWVWVSGAIAALIGLLALGLVGLGVVGLGVVGPGVVGPAWLASGPAAVVPLVLGLVLLGIASVIAWQVWFTALDVELHAEGILEVHLLGRRRGVPVSEVRRLRLSRLVSSRTPVVVETDRRPFLLLHPKAEVDAIAAALRRLDPHIADQR